MSEPGILRELSSIYEDNIILAFKKAILARIAENDPRYGMLGTLLSHKDRIFDRVRVEPVFDWRELRSESMDESDRSDEPASSPTTSRRTTRRRRITTAATRRAGGAASASSRKTTYKCTKCGKKSDDKVGRFQSYHACNIHNACLLL